MELCGKAEAVEAALATLRGEHNALDAEHTSSVAAAAQAQKEASEMEQRLKAGHRAPCGT